MPTQKDKLETRIIEFARSFPEIRAGIARLADVLKAPSYRTKTEGEWRSDIDPHQDGASAPWRPTARAVLVLGLRHPENRPALDWWQRGNTDGNRQLMAVSDTIQQWLQKRPGLESQPLPYHLERGGLFLKDAAVLAGLGAIGRSNLLLHPEWGPRIRLRSILIEGDLDPTGPSEGVSPCETCPDLCHRACPQNAFPEGVYSRPRCTVQLKKDIAEKSPGEETGFDGKPVEAIRYCRACELACPAGKNA